MELVFTFHAFGHPSVLSTHPTTIEITKQPYLSARGNCIVGVSSSKGLSDLPIDLKRLLTSPNGMGYVTLTTDEFTFAIEGRGAPGLTFAHPTDLVIRKSQFISDRTLMINADKSASDLPRGMVRELQNPACKVTVEISAAIME